VLFILLLALVGVEKAGKLLVAKLSFTSFLQAPRRKSWLLLDVYKSHKFKRKSNKKVKISNYVTMWPELLVQGMEQGKSFYISATDSKAVCPNELQKG
jgi:hypothetical protein